MQEVQATDGAMLGFMARLRRVFSVAERSELYRTANWKGLVAAIRGYLALIMVVRPLRDDQVPERFQPWVKLGRALATGFGYDPTGPLWWAVEAGAWLRAIVPAFGKCVENWTYMGDWKFKDEAPTGRWLVFWIPLFLTETTGKKVTDQKVWLAETRTKAGLPENYFSGFGSGVLVALLLLAYKKLTGKEVIPRGSCFRTDLFFEGGDRFRLRFVARGLDGDHWGWCEDAVSSVACPLLGVEVLEPSDTLP